MAAIVGKTFAQQFIDADLVPKGCCRIVLDIPVGGVVALYYKLYPDSDKLDKVDFNDLLKAGIDLPVVKME